VRATPRRSLAFTFVLGRSPIAASCRTPCSTRSTQTSARRGREILAVDSDAERSFTLVADRAGLVAGFCSIVAPSRDDDAGERTCEVAAIYVDPEAWRRGIGRALLEAAVREARADGWRTVTLWVFAANDRAHAFYEAFGFAPDGGALVDESSGRSEIRMRVKLAPSA
jgi:GNAT superfamily N-acetyltransferase